MIDQFRIILGTDTCQGLSLCLRDTETFKGILDILRYIRPLGLHFGIRSDIGHDLIHVQSFYGRSPVWNRHLIINLQRLQTKQLHPRRIMLFFGQLFHDLRCQTGIDPVSILLFIPEIIDASVYILYMTFFFHNVTSLNPFSLISSIRDASPVFTIFPSTITWVSSTERYSRILVLWVMIRRPPSQFF